MLMTFFFPKKVFGVDIQTGGLGIGIDAGEHITPIDTVTLPEFIKRNWDSLRKEHRLDYEDVEVKYPRFIQFCINAYQWIDYTFNSYDPEWVSGTGKSGKVRLFTDNWMDVYNFRVEDKPLMMTSHLYNNLGIQANYSILSVSYSIDLNTLFKNESSKHKKFNFNISLARLYAEAYLWQSNGGTLIRDIYKRGVEHRDDVSFDGLSFRAAGVMGFYIFNSKKFSFGAPYELSTYQLRSAGSWLAGLSGTFYKAKFDFTSLPPDVQASLEFPYNVYNLNYNAVNVIGGYSYNWVCNKHFLFNSTTMPGIGASFSFSDSTAGHKNLVSASIRQMLSLTYTNRQFFATGNATFHGNLFPTGSLAFMSGILNFQISSGVRF